MRFKKKVLLFCTICTSLIASNVYSDRLEDGHSWEPECEDCMRCRCIEDSPYWGRDYGDDLARGKNFEIDDVINRDVRSDTDPVGPFA